MLQRSGFDKRKIFNRFSQLFALWNIVGWLFEKVIGLVKVNYIRLKRKAAKL